MRIPALGSKLIYVIVALLIADTSFSQDYFQQEVNFKIEVKLDDVKHELSAFETIEYTNNSTSDLNYIYFHLWPNAYKNQNTAMAKQLLLNENTQFYYTSEAEKGYIDSLDFKVNGRQALLIIDPQTIDIAKLDLNEPLKPGSKITITTPFHVKVPTGMFSRLGHVDQQYQITQWFPKPAVFDKDGWHQMPYLDQGEFYSEFGSYEVAITLPKNYVVGATGDLQDEEEKDWINKRRNPWQEHLISKEGPPRMEDSFGDSFPVSDVQTKTLHYKQKNIHDFAWFCDKRYNIMKSEVELPHTHRKVTTWVLFTNGQAELWKKAVNYVNDGLYYYSLWNGDYPYNNCTAVDGALNAGGGMEYPNITIIGGTDSDFGLDDVIAHEVGHNWFYGVLGSNERLHAWMDEGINTYNEMRYVAKKYPTVNVLGEEPRAHDLLNTSRYPNKYEGYISYKSAAVRNLDQPCDLPAERFTKENYGGSVYSKTGMSFTYLMTYLGEETMDRAMQQYFDTWKFKHPQPNDLRKIMEEVSGKDLSWFFDDMLKTTKKLDYKIKSVKKLENGSFNILLKNTGKVKGPVYVCGIPSTTAQASSKTEKIWYEGFEHLATINFPPGDFGKFKIDCAENMPEINRNNNTIRTHGLFKKIEPLRLQPFVSLDDPDKSQLYFSPIMGWNNYNKVMLGLGVYNITFPEKKLEYYFAPMYAFGSKDLSGYADVNANFYPDNLFQQISLGVGTTRFAYSTDPLVLNYNKIAPRIEFVFKKKDLRSTLKHSVVVRSVIVLLDSYTADYNFTPPIYTPTMENYTINEVVFTRENSRVINPFKVMLSLQQSPDFVKASLEAKYSLTFKGDEKSLDFRFFAGTFLENSSSNAGAYNFRTSGWTGYQDYLFDHVFAGRTETKGLWAQQFVERDGGFKTFTFIGQTTKWITALNIKSSIPGILPIRLYADFGITAPDARLNDALLYDGGIDICVAKDIFEIYLPLIQCSDFKKTLDINNVKYYEQIRFTLNLNLLNPFNFIKNYKI